MPRLVAVSHSAWLGGAERCRLAVAGPVGLHAGRAVLAVAAEVAGR